MRKRVVLYCRQSDSDGAGERSLSLDSQARVLHEDAARFGWTVIDEIRDADLKGCDERRPGLLSLYERCRAGDVDVVAFWKLDRLARLLRLQENVLYELAQLGVEVYSNQDPHIGTPLFRHVLGAFNEELTRLISANVRRGLRERAHRGLPHGIAPFGYRRREKGGAFIPSTDAPIVRDIFVWRAEGASLGEIVDRLHARNVPPPGRAACWSRPCLRNILANPVYTGVLSIGDVTIVDAHPAIIEPELWARIDAIQARHRDRAPRRKDDSSWLEGAIEHACGRAMYRMPASHAGAPARFVCRTNGGGERDVSPCTVRPRMIHVARAEAITLARLIEDLDGLLPWRSVMREAKAAFREASPSAEAARRRIEAQIARAEAKRERWLEVYTSGQVDRERFQREMASADHTLQEGRAALAALPTLPQAEAIEASWRALRSLRNMLPDTDSDQLGWLLRQLGTVVVAPAGQMIRNPGKAGPHMDAGSVAIRYRAEWAPFFPDRRG